MKKLVLVDDHVIIRNGLKELIERLGPYQVVDQFDNGLEFVNAIPFSYEPDLIVMDISMPEMDGDEVMQVLKEKGISLPVLILTLNNDEERLIRLFRRGVRGYLQKNCTAAMMKEALEEIFTRGYYLNEHMQFALGADKAVREHSPNELLDILTPKEREFLRLICNDEEYTYKQISEIMSVSHRTVDGYREALFDKLGLKSKTGLVLFVLRNNLLDKI
jgi:two-component system invasion response regulator UvrY